MKPAEQAKKMQDIGLFESLKRSGLLEQDANIDELVERYQAVEDIVPKVEKGTSAPYWLWGSRGCFDRPPTRP